MFVKHSTSVFISANYNFLPVICLESDFPWQTQFPMSAWVGTHIYVSTRSEPWLRQSSQRPYWNIWSRLALWWNWVSAVLRVSILLSRIYTRVIATGIPLETLLSLDGKLSRFFYWEKWVQPMLNGGLNAGRTSGAVAVAAVLSAIPAVARPGLLRPWAVREQQHLPLSSAFWHLAVQAAGI